MTDIFKLLSRSTSLGRKATAGQNLPSSGQHANPQIFGKELEGNIKSNTKPTTSRSVSPSILGKRKRKGGAVINVPTELDFFGDGDVPAVTSDVVNNTKLKTAHNGHATPRDDVVVKGASRAENERKAVLRAHKIKVTVLEEEMPKEKSEKNKKKKRRKDSKEEAPGTVSKHHKRPIYPEPLESFAQLRSRYSISRRLAENLEAQGYKVPTEVQLAALPLLMDDGVTESTQSTASGCHLMSIAPTGSGKTLAFLIPTINAILREKRKDENEHTQAIVLAPTRELAHQIVNEGKKLLQNTGIRITLMRKGMRLAGLESAAHDASESDGDESSEDEAQTTVVKSHIIVSTPMVLTNSIQAKDGGNSPLSLLRYLILDEADVLLDPLFRDQVEIIWNACTNPGLRVTLWSATMASSIEDFALAQFARLGPRERPPIVRLVVGLKDTALPTLTHTMTYTGTEAGKLLALRQLLHPTAPDTDSGGRKSLRPPFLVFTQTIERAKALQAELRYDIPPEAGGSARMAALHSEMSEKAREKIMTDFRKGEIWVIITTDLLARGVDFRGLNGVVNYDIPTSAAAYVHRVGRTGRAGREGGVAVTFYTKEDIPYVKPIANVIAASEKLRVSEASSTSEHKDLQKWILDALPTPTKREKKQLKKQGVEARRKGVKSAMITTKSGYERRQDGKRKDKQSAAKGANAQKLVKRAHPEADDFAGFSD